MTTEIRSKSAIGAHIDVFADRVHEDVTRKWRAHQQHVEQACKEIADLKVSRDYTLEGRNKAIDGVREKAIAGLKPLRDVVDTVRRRFADAEQSALPARAKRTAQDLPDLMLEREIRDHLRGKDALQVFELYIAAAASGDDQFCRAVEEAPTAFPLLTPELRAQGRQVRIAHSPAAETLQELHAELEIHEAILSAAEHDLK